MKLKWPKSVTIRGAIIGGVFVIVAAIITVIGPIIFNDNKNEEPTVPEEDLVVSNVRPIIDQRTRIHESFTIVEGKGTVKTGILSAFWEVLLSNNGANDLSVIMYDLVQVDEDFPSISYTHMKQGLYTLEDGALIPVQFPITIPAGVTKALFLRVGITMDEKAYQLVKSKFASEQRVTLEMIINFLRLNELDFYGNAFTEDDAGIYSLPPIDEIKEQVFGVSFETGRGTKAVGIVSWYRHGLFQNALRSN